MRHFGKKFLSLMLVFVFVFGLLPDMKQHKVYASTQLPAPVDGKITLTEDVTLDSTWNVTETITLDLNGHGIHGTSSVIIINGGNLTITDSNTQKIHYFDIENGKAININDENGTNSFTGGYITGGTGSSSGGYWWNDGGGVWLKSGTFTLNNGSIIGNSSGFGGGVEVYDGTFTMNGGKIVYNGGNGGVCLRSGSDQYNLGWKSTANFVMAGGSIQNNQNDGLCC